MKLTFLGATGTVTGSKYLIEYDATRVLIDCGLYQGKKALRLRNWQSLPIDAADVDAVILTHAHLDHSGFLPRLIQLGFTGPVFCTQATADLCEILLPDAGHIQEEDANRANRHHYSKHHPAKPLYTEHEARVSLKQLTPKPYGKTHTFGPLTFSFHHAGHILGAAFVKIQSDSGRSVLFSGDIGRHTDPLMRAPAQIQPADYVVTESTYGDRRHPKIDPLAQIGSAITQTIARGGSVVIPAFAVGRAQLLLYYLHELRQNKTIPTEVPIYLDSPMAINASELMQRHTNEHRLSNAAAAAICRVARYTRTVDESKAIYGSPGHDAHTTPKIILSASGMATGGRVLHHLKQTLPDSKNTIIITGFQVPGTRGDRLLRGESSIKIHGEMIPVRAQIVNLDSLSAHADCDELTQWLSTMPSAPRGIYIVHGEAQAAAALQAQIQSQLSWSSTIPTLGQTVEF